MNKTITVNLGGTVFHIEEAAYNMLKQYIDAIELRFGKGDSGKEILNDIEARMAELLQPRINEGKQAILPEDVQFVITQMGKPEDYGEGQSDASSTGSNTYNIPPDGLKRRVFRNADDRVIAGVASGISAYFGWDPIWLRIAFALCLVFGYGVGFLLYIILWIALPVARTPIERLQMRGEDVTLKNIEEAIRREADAVSASIRKHAYGPTGTFFTELFTVIGKIVKWTVFSVLIFIAFLFLISTLAILFGHTQFSNHFIIGNSSFGGANVELFRQLQSMIPTGKLWALRLGVALAGFSPAIVIMVWATKTIFKWHINTGIVILSGFVLFFVGIGIMISTAKSIKHNFGMSATIRHSASAAIAHKHLIIKMDGDSRASDYNDDLLNIYGDKINLRTINKHDTIILNNVQFTIEPGDNDSLEILTDANSRGSTTYEARALAEQIKYNYTLNDSTLTLSTRSFNTNPNSPWRLQSVKLIIKVPVNTYISLEKNTHSFIDKDMQLIDNNLEVSNMSGHRLFMQSAGIQCLDCSDADKIKYNDDDNEKERYHNQFHKHINVRSHGKHITIDDNGVEVTDDDGNAHQKNKSYEGNED